MSYLKRAREVFDVELAAVKSVRGRLNRSFDQAVDLVVGALRKRRKLVVLGVGKSGNIGRKIAATFTSTGAPAVLLDSVDALHGDLGILNDGDVVLALSYSGETDELVNLLPAIKRFTVKIVAITSSAKSTLGKSSEVVLNVKVSKEACPFNLAPTTSTTAMLVLGDAIAVSLMKSKKFTKKNFYYFHPGGQLGKKLLLVKNVMHSGKKLPLINENVPMTTAIIEMTKKRFGCLGVISKNNNLTGIITDGDLRRHMENNILEKRTSCIMTKKPKTVDENIFAIEALNIMKKNKITQVFVTKNNKPIGILHIHDCIELELA